LDKKIKEYEGTHINHQNTGARKKERTRGKEIKISHYKYLLVLEKRRVREEEQSKRRT